MNPPTDLQIRPEPLGDGIICPEPLTRECLIESQNKLIEKWSRDVKQLNDWIDWCYKEGYCGKLDVD